MQQRIRASSHMADQVKRPNPKLLSRGEDRSSLNILSMHFCQILSILLEKGLTSQLEFEFPFLKDPNSYREVKILAPKVSKSTAM